MHRALTAFEGGDIGQRCFRNILQCLSREERLMAGDDDIGEGEQARKHVVLNHLRR